MHAWSVYSNVWRAVFTFINVETCMPGLYTVTYGVLSSHLFTELQISPIEVHISAIQLQISTLDLQISTIQLEISPNRLNCRYLQLNWRYLQINCRYLQIPPIQLNCRYMQFDQRDKISAPRRKNRCAMIQVSGLIKSCI